MDELDEVEVTDAYLRDVIVAADDLERRTMPGDVEHDLAQYAQTLIQEIYRQRSRIAYLEGWKEATEASLDGSKNTR